MVYDGREYLLTQRGTGNVGNVGGNAELRREGAAHNTTKPKTRVGRDLLAHPLKVCGSGCQLNSEESVQFLCKFHYELGASI